MSRNKAYTSSIDVISYKNNPWVSSLAHTIKKGRSTIGFASSRQSMVDTNTGEVTGDVAITGVQRVVDKENFVKVFARGLDAVFDFSPSAKDVFVALMHCYMSDINTPENIYISHERLKDYGYKRSNPTFKSGLNELCLKEFIAPIQYQPNMYWVNPNMVFKGNRLRIINEYILKGSDENQSKLEARY